MNKLWSTSDWGRSAVFYEISPLPFQDSNSDGKVDRKGIESLIHSFQGTTHNDRRFRGMPYFNFDLVIGQEFRDQGSMILEDLATAADRADQLADELCIVRPELRLRGCAIRVTDDGEKEVYRTPLDTMSSGHARLRSE